MTNSQQTSASKKDTGAGKSPFSCSTVSTLTVLFLIVCAVASAYGARHNPWSLGFVVFIYVTLAALFVCMSLMEKRKGSAGLKVAVWALATLLTVSLVCRMTAILPPEEVSSFVWVLVFVLSVVIGSLYALALYHLPAEAAVYGKKDELKKVGCAEEQV